MKPFQRKSLKALFFLLLCIALFLTQLLSNQYKSWAEAFPLLALYIIAAYFTGKALCGGTSIYEKRPYLRSLIFILLGFGIFSIYIYLISLLGLAKHILISYLVLAMLIIGYYIFRRAKNRGKEINNTKIKLNYIQSGMQKILLISSIAMVLLVIFIFAPLPEGFHDSLLYHLALPQQVVTTGELTHMDHNFTTYLPLNGEMLYIPLMANDYACRMLQFSFALITLGLIIFSLSAKKHIFTIFAILALLSVWDFVHASITTLVEINIAAYGFASWLLIKKYMTTKQKQYLILAGTMIGFAAGTKYQGIVLMFCISLAFLIITIVRKESLRMVIRSLSLYILIGFALFLPWMIRSVILTGNPFFPAFYSIFGASNLSPNDAETILGIWTYADPGTRSISGFLTLPLKESLKAGGFALLSLPIITLIFTFRRYKRFLLGPLLIAFTFYTMWFISASNPRYLIPFIPFIALIYIPITALFKKKKILYPFIALFTALFFINYIPIIYSLNIILKPFNFYTKKLDRAGYLTRIKTFPYEGFNYLNQNTAEDSKVILIGESRGYNLKRPYHASSPYETQLIAEYLKNSDDLSQLKRSLEHDGFKYALTNYAEWYRTKNELNLRSMNFIPENSREEKLFMELCGSMKLIYKDKLCYIYRINDT